MEPWNHLQGLWQKSQKKQHKDNSKARLPKSSEDTSQPPGAGRLT